MERINVKPKELSALDLYAAQRSAGAANLPDPLWPGAVLEELKAEEPQCAATKAYQARKADEREAKKMPRKAPKVPRNTEPCNLIQFCGLLSGGAFACVVALAVFGWIGVETLDVLASLITSAVVGVR